MSGLVIAMTPFSWRRFKYEKTVMNTAIFLGPFQVVWDNG